MPSWHLCHLDTSWNHKLKWNFCNINWKGHFVLRLVCAHLEISHFMEAVWNFDLERSGRVNLVIEHSDVTDCWNKNEKTIYLLACFVQNFQTLGRLYREFKVGWMAIQTPSVQHPWPHTVEMLKCSRGFLNLSFCQWRTCCIFAEDMALDTCTLDMSNHLSLMGFDLPPWSPFKFFWTLSTWPQQTDTDQMYCVFRFMISFALFFMMGKPTGGDHSQNGGPLHSNCIVLGPLFWECPQMRLHPALSDLWMLPWWVALVLKNGWTVVGWLCGWAKRWV